MIERTKHVDTHAPVNDPPVTDEWILLVGRIQNDEKDALAELYQIFGRGVRFIMLRQLGPQDIDDRVHDAFLAVVKAIQKGDLRDPACLMGFVRTIVRRHVAMRIDHLVQTRRQQVPLELGPTIADGTDTPEQQAMGVQVVLMLKVLRSMSTRDCNILTRFYLHGQSQEQICREMYLTDTQFRLLKSGAKARFGDLGRCVLGQEAFTADLMRLQQALGQFARFDIDDDRAADIIARFAPALEAVAREGLGSVAA